MNIVLMFLFVIFSMITMLALIMMIAGFVEIFNENSTDNGGLFLKGLMALLFFSVATFLLANGSGLFKDQGVKADVNVNSNTGQLEAKIKDLSNLREDLIAKKEQGLKLQSEYQEGIQKLKVEIRAEQKANEIMTFDQAQKQPRISFDLQLIQRKQAYIAKLQEIDTKLQQSTYELEFLERQAIDDLKLAQTLNNDEVEKMVGDINSILAKYLPEAGELKVVIDPNTMQTPEQIWESINQKK